MYFSRLFRVKEGKLETLREWFRVLAVERREEAVATFAHEGIAREIFVLFKGSDGQHYAIGANDAVPKPADPSVPINVEHAAIKRECLEPVSEPGEILLDLSV